MKKLLFQKKHFARIIAFLIIVLGATTSCSAFPSKVRTGDYSVNQKDSVMRKALGDSIYTIIKDAKNVSATLHLKATDHKKDSLLEVKVSKCDKYLLNFILSAPRNYQSNEKVYGQYMPNFSLKFASSKSNVCYIYVDFGMKKWSVCTEDKKELVRFDMPTSDVLRLANQLFPNYDYFKNLINLNAK